MYLQRDLFVAQFQRMTPGQSPSQVSAVVNSVLVAGLVYHLVLATLFVWLALKIRAGRNHLVAARARDTCAFVVAATGAGILCNRATPNDIVMPLAQCNHFLSTSVIHDLAAPVEPRTISSTGSVVCSAGASLRSSATSA